MNEKTINHLRQLAVPEHAADIMCAAIDEFEEMPPNEAVRYIDSIRCTDTAVHVKAKFPNDSRRIQLVIGIACDNELTHENLVTDEEVDNILNDSDIRMLHFVWVITKDSDLEVSAVKTEDIQKKFSAINDTQLEMTTISVVKAQ